MNVEIDHNTMGSWPMNLTIKNAHLMEVAT